MTPRNVATANEQNLNTRALHPGPSSYHLRLFTKGWAG